MGRIEVPQDVVRCTPQAYTVQLPGNTKHKTQLNMSVAFLREGRAEE